MVEKVWSGFYSKLDLFRCKLRIIVTCNIAGGIQEFVHLWGGVQSYVAPPPITMVLKYECLKQCVVCGALQCWPCAWVCNWFNLRVNSTSLYARLCITYTHTGVLQFNISPLGVSDILFYKAFYSLPFVTIVFLLFFILNFL